MNGAIKKFLQYSFEPIDYQFEKLTKGEQSLTDEAEFRQLSNALKAEHNIAVLDYTSGKLFLVPCPDKTEAEETFYEWCHAMGITSGDCNWMVMS